VVDTKLLSQKQESVEVLDFRNLEIRQLFLDHSPVEALNIIKKSKSEDSFIGISRPFKLLTIPHEEDLEYLIKGNYAKKSKWIIWEKLLSESNLNLEIIVLLVGSLPEYKDSRNKLYLPEFLTEKRIRILWASSLNGIYCTPNQKFPTALLNWKSENLEEANFDALIKPFTVTEIFQELFNSSKPGEIYNPGLRQAAFGTGYKKESKDILYEAAKQTTGSGNLLTSVSKKFPDLKLPEIYSGKLNPSVPLFREGIFAKIDQLGKSSISMCQLFGLTNSIVSKDQIPHFSKRLEKSYKDYVNSIVVFVKNLKSTNDSLSKLIQNIDAKDGFNEDEYSQIIENNIDYYSAKPDIPTSERPIRVSTVIYSEVLEGLKKGHNLKEYKLLLNKLIKEIRPKNKENSVSQLNKIWSPITKEGGILDPFREFSNIDKEVKKMFGNKIFRFLFNLPWSIFEKTRLFLFLLASTSLLLGTFWSISTFIAGEPGDEMVFRSSGSTKLDNFITDFFRTTNWEELLFDIIFFVLVAATLIYFAAKYVISNIYRVGKNLNIDLLPEIIRDSKVFLWKTLINDWVLASDRNEVIQYLEALIVVLEEIDILLSEKYLDIEFDTDEIFKDRYLEPNPVLEANLNSVSENGIFKDFEGSVSILKTDLISLLDLSFEQEWMKIRGATGRKSVPERILKNFRMNLIEFEKRIAFSSILDPKTALTFEGQGLREKIVKDLWSEGDYPRDQVLDLLNLDENSELVQFLNPEEISLLNGRSESLLFLRYAPLVLDIPPKNNLVRTKESKVAGVIRFIPMSFYFEYLRFNVGDLVSQFESSS